MHVLFSSLLGYTILAFLKKINIKIKMRNTHRELVPMCGFIADYL